MTLIQLEYVIAVHNHKSFSKASEACFVTQPTLSMQIQKLEDELGVILFDRKKKPIGTTEIGEMVVEQARDLVSGEKAIKELVSQYKGAIAGELKVGIIPTVAPYLLPLFLPNVIKAYPTLNLQIEEKTTEEIIDNLLADHIDIGILATPLSNPRITEYPLYSEGMYFYVSPKHPLYQKESIDINEIDGKDMWLLHKGHCFRNQVLKLCERFNKDHIQGLAFESGSIETIIKIIDSHNGLTMIPETALFTLAPEQKKHVRPIEKNQPGREISIVVSRTYLKKQLIQELNNMIVEALPATLKHNKVRILDIN
ncbi:hydrogen peroxide-inducible genes activator [Luteibaculum oceani]|uniref:LysR family transcriptional regulator n=1 Tax=Luteibaculum oceani TaxID=1294296 RepID=A0A5C6UUC2_9FLAO|nr:hydrogen peroxide-inducible genes activator [Luteibaculum oceani]TXC76220.1 LysR family transcriptional regulator [Luteibaculum oceani]